MTPTYTCTHGREHSVVIPSNNMAEAEGVPYLNSLISLISKSDIRYEGILYTINMDDSSIALSQGDQGGTLTASRSSPLP